MTQTARRAALLLSSVAAIAAAWTYLSLTGPSIVWQETASTQLAAGKVLTCAPAVLAELPGVTTRSYPEIETVSFDIRGARQLTLSRPLDHPVGLVQQKEGGVVELRVTTKSRPPNADVAALEEFVKSTAARLTASCG